MWETERRGDGEEGRHGGGETEMRGDREEGRHGGGERDEGRHGGGETETRGDTDEVRQRQGQTWRRGHRELGWRHRASMDQRCILYIYFLSYII